MKVVLTFIVMMLLFDKLSWALTAGLVVFILD